MIKAVLFDVYGTLLTSDLLISPYSDLMRAFQLNDEERERARREFMTVAHETFKEWRDSLNNQYPERVVREETLKPIEAELRRHEQSFRLFDGVPEVLAGIRAKGYTTALITNLAASYKEPILRLGLDEMVDYRIYSCDVGFMKPEPEIFEIALAAVEARPEEAVMVGDNLHDDIQGAKRAGIRPVHIEAGAPGALDAIAQLPRFLEEL